MEHHDTAVIPYSPVTGSLNIPILGVKNVKMIKLKKRVIKTTIAIILLHLNLLIISKYDTNSPKTTAMKNDAISISQLL